MLLLDRVASHKTLLVLDMVNGLYTQSGYHDTESQPIQGQQLTLLKGLGDFFDGKRVLVSAVVGGWLRVLFHSNHRHYHHHHHHHHHHNDDNDNHNDDDDNTNLMDPKAKRQRCGWSVALGVWSARGRQCLVAGTAAAAMERP